MKTAKTSPHLVIEPSKEVIFYMPKQSDAEQDISTWIKDLNLPNYKCMIINSKCMFNRFKNKGCN